MATTGGVATGDDLHGAIDAYIAARYAPDDEVLRELLRAAAEEGLPAIQVPPALGRLLSMLVHLTGARRILEIGTLGGYSAIWMARALPRGGRLISLEINPKHAALARRFIAQAGLTERVEVREGPALASLEALSNGGSFDMVFIDADKEGYPGYLDWAKRLVRPGGLIVADNTLLQGAVVRAGEGSGSVRAVQEYNDRVAQDPALEAVIVLSRHGLEGLSIARVRDEEAEQVAQYHYE